MTENAIVDTGPLVAFLDRNEKYHRWVIQRVRELSPPLLVCEAVLTEAAFLLAPMPAAIEGLFKLLDKRALQLSFNLAENISEIQSLCGKYSDLPISLADACVIRMAELHSRHSVFTLDSDFAIYRKNGRDKIKLIHPQSV